MRVLLSIVLVTLFLGKGFGTVQNTVPLTLQHGHLSTLKACSGTRFQQKSHESFHAFSHYLTEDLEENNTSEQVDIAVEDNEPLFLGTWLSHHFMALLSYLVQKDAAEEIHLAGVLPEYLFSNPIYILFRVFRI